jgi:PEP-CTERM motif
MSMRSLTHSRSDVSSKLQVAALALGLLATAPAAAFADTYFTANFTFGVFGGNANQQPPFQGVVAPYPAGGMFTGSLVYDQNLIPAPGTGFVNIFFSSFPDIAVIPTATALNLPLGSLPAFTLADAVTQSGSQEAAIQYNNGVFAGLFYISDFTFNGNPYELQIQGGSLSIVPIINGNPGFNSLVNGFVQGPLFNVQPFTPVAPGVPEPSSWAMMLIGFAAVGCYCLTKKNQKALAAA